MPKKKSYKREKEAALKWANQWRGVIGLPPVDKLAPGERKSMNSCPIARTIRDGASGWVVKIGPYITDLQLKGKHPKWLYQQDKFDLDLSMYAPKAVCDFIGQFDAGNIPELVEK